MALHTLTITSHQLEFVLPTNSPFTDKRRGWLVRRG